VKRQKSTVNVRLTPPDLILIVTEGEKTEPLYFEGFPVHTKMVKRIVIGTGRNTLSLVEQTDIELEKALGEYREEHKIKLRCKDVCVWCVFDKDSFSSSDFGNAINQARAKSYHVAYSNQAFELWYLLHFDYHQSAISRNRYKEMLTQRFPFKYEKNDLRMYKVLLDKQIDAVKNARTLISQYAPHSPNDDNPSTTVFELVEFLNQYFPK